MTTLFLQSNSKYLQNLRHKDKPGAEVMLHFVPKIWMERLSYTKQSCWRQDILEISPQGWEAFQNNESCCDWFMACPGLLLRGFIMMQWIVGVFSFFFLNTLFIFREMGKEGEREGETSMCEIHDQLPLTHPQPGTWPAPQPHALTGNRTGELSVCRRHSVHWATPARAGGVFS